MSKSNRLTNFEQEKIVPNFIFQFTRHIGRENQVKAKEITKAYQNVGVKLVPSRVRKIIHYVRVNGLVQNLIADNGGYYVCLDNAEVEIYLASLWGRISQQMEAYDAVRRQLDEKIEFEKSIA